MKRLEEKNVFFVRRLPSFARLKAAAGPPSIERAIVISDSALRGKRFLEPWMAQKRMAFHFVRGGEGAKSLQRLPFHIKAILEKSQGSGPRRLLFISLGGGSAGDLTGFIATIYKRGARLVHVPSTWLAAIDSSHGGKTGLSFSGGAAAVKNLLGAYHFPSAVFIAEEALRGLGPAYKREALGELLKAALIEGGAFFRMLKKALLSEALWQERRLWLSLVQKAILLKLKICAKDPFEKKGLRRLLNFGHTAGHVLESAHALPHGIAVLEGMRFAFAFSRQKRLLGERDFKELCRLLPARLDFAKIDRSLFRRLLREDKKSSSRGKINFVFIRAPGDLVIKEAPIEDILDEGARQGLVR